MGNTENAFMEYAPDLENFEFDESELSGEQEIFSDAELMELADELLEVDSEAELDQFLGKLIKNAGKKLGRFARSRVGRMVGGYLKGAARMALPLAGKALGGFVGGPLGAKIGSGLASAAGRAIGLEAEMLNAEDQEFEGAKQFVRMSGEALKSALMASPNVNPASVAQQAVAAAAAKLAPGLMAAKPATVIPLSQASGRSGRWVRRGRNIVILNC